MEIKNAIITSIFLGFEDHGIPTATLYLNYGDGTTQGFGGYNLRGQSSWWIHVLETLQVAEWKNLVKTACRVKLDQGVIVAIGHIVEDVWFEPRIAYGK